MNDKEFTELLESVRWMKRHQAGKTQEGRVTELALPDVRHIREKTHLTQREFASLVGVSVRTLQNWEQGHRRPTGAAAALLRVTEANPKAVLDALH